LRRIPSAAKPLSAANGVGRSSLLEQAPLACKRSFLFWQGANDTATLHDLYSTTPGKAQQPEHLSPSRLFAGKAMTRQVAFACNIARPKARDMPRSGHPAPTSLPCQPSRFHLPAPHQANPPSAQHSAREQERAETARQGSLTVTFTARKSPVQATSRTRQPAPAARRYLFQSSFHLRPTVGFTCRRDKQDSTACQPPNLRKSRPHPHAEGGQVQTMLCR
jgi:hypothetical protein